MLLFLRRGMPGPRRARLTAARREAIETRARVRSEVLAPFRYQPQPRARVLHVAPFLQRKHITEHVWTSCRLVRLVLFGFFGVSASVGLAIALVQLVGAVGGGQNALPVQEALQARSWHLTR